MTNAPPQTVVLLARGLAAAATQTKAPPGFPTEHMGEPVTYWWKPILKPGVYAHPDPKYGMVEFTRDDCATADRCTREWIASGGKPAVPMHGHKGKNGGWLIDTRWDGEQLHALHQLIGDDARREAARNETSVGFTRKFTDPTTHKVFPALIEHNALVNNAVASGLGHFVALARTDGGPSSEEPVFELVAEGKNHMTPAQLQMARSILGDNILVGDAEVPLSEENAVDALLSAADSATRYYSEAESTKVELSRTAEELEEVKTRLATQMVEMSRATSPQPPSASELYWAGRAVLAEKDKAVRSGAITPAVAAKAEERFLRKPVDFGKITLSREVEADDHKLAAGFAQLMDFYETVQGNTPRQRAGETTGRQELIELARSEPGAGDPNPRNGKDRQMEMLEQQTGRTA